MAAVEAAPRVGAPVLDHVTISLQGGSDTALAQMLSVCKQALPGWADVSEQDVEFSTVSGGISNINARLAPAPEFGLAPVLVKVFGAKTELIVDRAAERITVVELGRQGFGPQVLALFGNGRVEEWLHCAGLSPVDMCDARFVPRIAALLARFHSLDVPLPRDRHTPFAVIYDWLRQARTLSFEDEAKQAAHAAIDFDAIAADVAATEAACALTASPLVLGHNDLLSGNILVLQEPGFNPESPDMDRQIVFIDFEYGAYTSRGFDIGNHFCEYAGFECDYSRYPGREQQELFWRHYLHATHHGSDGRQAGSNAAPPPERLQDDVLDRLVAEANVWSLAAHLYWGVWSIIQACYSPIDFDYMTYSGTRLSEFRRRRDGFLATAVQVFGSTP